MYRIVILAFFVTLLTFQTGCPQGAAQVAPPEAPAVPVAKPIFREVTDYVDFTGRTNAKDAVTIQARVTGNLVKLPFKEGDHVKKGDLLFEIDPRPYEALHEAALAQVSLNI